MPPYLVAFFLFLLATARRSFFFRRRARFLTLSLPWLCPIGVNTRPSSAGSKAISLLQLKFRFQSHSAASATRPPIGVVCFSDDPMRAYSKVSLPRLQLANGRSGRDSRARRRWRTRRAETSPALQRHCRNTHQRELTQHETDQPGKRLLHEAV